MTWVDLSNVLYISTRYDYDHGTTVVNGLSCDYYDRTGSRLLRTLSRIKPSLVDSAPEKSRYRQLRLVRTKGFHVARGKLATNLLVQLPIVLIGSHLSELGVY